jgi:acyl CoA:acetate/3-ketoacid CoA transferase beta subunit
MPVSVVIGDFNGDALSDLATANVTSGNVSILLGTVPGQGPPGAPGAGGAPGPAGQPGATLICTKKVKKKRGKKRKKKTKCQAVTAAASD